MLSGKVPAEALTGRYLLVGMTATGLGDSAATPVNRQQHAMPGVELLGHALYTLRSGDTLRPAPPLAGAMMLFGEKYGDEVRVLDIGSSRELCGGTHVARTGDIGVFKIVSEGGVAAGIRRVEAVTGDNALAYLQQLEATVGGLAGTLKATPAEVPARVAAVLDHVRALEREITALKGRLASAQGDEMLAQAVDVKGANGSIKVLAATLQGADAKALRETMDKLKDKLKSAAIVLAAVEGGKVQLAAGVTADVLARPGARVKAGELVNFVALQVGGKGGGKPDLAMAGGTDAAALPAALATVAGWVGERL